MGQDNNTIEGKIDFIKKIKSRDDNFFEDLLKEKKEEQKKAGNMHVLIIKIEKRTELPQQPEVQKKLEKKEKQNKVMSDSTESEHTLDFNMLK